MAFPSTIEVTNTLTDVPSIDIPTLFYAEITREPNGMVRIERSTDPALPTLMALRHSVQKGKLAVATDRHLMQFLESLQIANGSVGQQVVNLTASTPRGFGFSIENVSSKLIQLFCTLTPWNTAPDGPLAAWLRGES